MNNSSLSIAESPSSGRKRCVAVLKISRPLSWMMYSGVAALGLMYGGGGWTQPALALVAIFTFPYGLWLFGWNDLYDIESDRLNPRKDSWVHGGRIPPGDEILLRVLVGSSILIPVAVVFLLNFRSITIAFVAVAYLLGVLYSVPPVRLKEVPLLDGYCSATAIVAIFAAGFTVGASVTRIPMEVLLSLPALVAIQLYAQVGDIESDRQAGHLTGAVRFGKRRSYFFCALFTLLSLVAVPFFNFPTPIILVLVAQFAAFFASWLLPERIAYRQCLISLVAFDLVCAVALVVQRL